MFDYFRDVFNVPESMDISGSIWGFIVLILALFTAHLLAKKVKSKKGDKDVIS